MIYLILKDPSSYYLNELNSPHDAVLNIPTVLPLHDYIFELINDFLEVSLFNNQNKYIKIKGKKEQASCRISIDT